MPGAHSIRSSRKGPIADQQDVRRPDRLRPLRRSSGQLLGAAVVVVVGINTGLQVSGGGTRAAIVLPLAAGAALGLVALALVRFEVFVLAVLVARASLDAGKLATQGTSAADPAALLSMLFMFAALIWLAVRRRESGPLPQSPMRSAMVFFLAAQFVSVVGSGRPLSSLLEFGRLTSVGVMFIVLDRLVTNGMLRRRVMAAVFLSSVVPLGAALISTLQGNQLVETKGGLSRVTSVFNQSNGFSRYLMLLIIMGAALYRHCSPQVRLPLALALGGSTVCLLLTYTRSAWFATVVGVVVVGGLQNRAVVAAVFVTGLVAAVAVPSVSGRLADLGEDPSNLGTDSGNSLLWRLDYWSEILPLANENPVTGIGLKMTQFSTDEAKQPHNDFVRAYVETGFVGLLSYVILLVAFARTAIQALRRTSHGIDRGIAVGFAGCVASFVLVSAVSNVISSVVILWYFVAFAAAANSIAWRADAVADVPERELVRV